MTKLNAIGIFILVLLGLITVKSSYSISVAADFLENDTILLQKGESRLYGIRLQNTKDDDAFLKITYDQNIANIIDHMEIYRVPAKSSISITFNVSSDRIGYGQSRIVSYTIEEQSGSGEGVPVLLKISKNFKVKVQERESRKASMDYIGYGIGAAALVLYLAYSLKSKPKIKFRKR